MADPNWNRGFYYDGVPPHNGMKLARRKSQFPSHHTMNLCALLVLRFPVTYSHDLDGRMLTTHNRDRNDHLPIWTRVGTAIRTSDAIGTRT